MESCERCKKDLKNYEIKSDANSELYEGKLCFKCIIELTPKECKNEIQNKLDNDKNKYGE
jgi:hypothetical protein